jgi:hypothetical protein
MKLLMLYDTKNMYDSDTQGKGSVLLCEGDT